MKQIKIAVQLVLYLAAYHIAECVFNEYDAWLGIAIVVITTWILVNHLIKIFKK